MAKASSNKRKQQKEAQLRKKKQQRYIWIGVGIAVLLLAGGLIAQSFQKSQARQSIGDKVGSLGQQHIADGDDHAPYNSDPPTSGAHGNPVRAGFYDTLVPDENVVHNLEHGHIAISYDCAQLDDCETVKDNLRQIIEKYDTWKVIAVPRTNRDAPIALTAWQRIDLMDEYDEARITTFIDAWRDKAPEKTPE